jgi:hypothetical protein
VCLEEWKRKCLTQGHRFIEPIADARFKRYEKWITIAGFILIRLGERVHKVTTRLRFDATVDAGAGYDSPSAPRPDRRT